MSPPSAEQTNGLWVGSSETIDPQLLHPNRPLEFWGVGLKGSSRSQAALESLAKSRGYWRLQTASRTPESLGVHSEGLQQVLVSFQVVKSVAKGPRFFRGSRRLQMILEGSTSSVETLASLLRSLGLQWRGRGHLISRIPASPRAGLSSPALLRFQRHPA